MNFMVDSLNFPETHPSHRQWVPNIHCIKSLSSYNLIYNTYIYFQSGEKKQAFYFFLC